MQFATRPMLWTGRIISALVVLFLLFDSITKLMKTAPVMEAFARLGYPQRVAPIIGAILLVCIIVYVIPRTSILGAILLTAYLGGATDSNVRSGYPLYLTLFPVIFGVLVWVGIFLRNGRLRSLIPVDFSTSHTSSSS